MWRSSGCQYGPQLMAAEKLPGAAGHSEAVASALKSGDVGTALQQLPPQLRGPVAAIAKGAFTNGLMDLEQAKRYRDLVLAPGGTKPAADLVSDFLGRRYGFEAFREWLAPRD